jgi:hypothetical protein
MSAVELENVATSESGKAGRGGKRKEEEGGRQLIRRIAEDVHKQKSTNREIVMCDAYGEERGKCRQNDKDEQGQSGHGRRSSETQSRLGSEREVMSHFVRNYRFVRIFRLKFKVIVTNG